MEEAIFIDPKTAHTLSASAEADTNEHVFTSPLVLLPVRCVCGSETYHSSGLCPACQKAAL